MRFSRVDTNAKVAAVNVSDLDIGPAMSIAALNFLAVTSVSINAHLNTSIFCVNTKHALTSGHPIHFNA